MTERSDDTMGEQSVNEARSSAVDWSVLEALKVLQRPGKPDLRVQLMTVYLNSSPALMDAARAAVRDDDARGLMNAAHALKSSSLSVGARLFGESCAELERIGRSDSLQQAPEILSRADSQFSAVCDAFRGALERSG